MTPALIWSNVLAYALQIGVLIGLGALAPAVFRMRIPRARLLYWQLLLVVCLALPWLQSWRHEVIAGAVQVTTIVTAVAVASAPVHRAIPFTAIALWLLAAGAAFRLGLLVFGLVRLSAYRRRGEELPAELRMPGAARVSMMLSEDVAGPVTFGWREPVVLLPASFLSLEPEMRDAILCHELQHVERCDWLFTIAEELVRSVFWFHPAVWWIVGEIQLAREQTVDQSVIEMTQAREPYVDALLLMSGAISEYSEGCTEHAELATAPMFLRRRHLKRRLVEVMKEVRMSTTSKMRLWCAMGAATAVIAVACWIAIGAFPLVAAPQLVNDASGVSVNTSGLALIHRSAVPYPAEAQAKGIDGAVVVQMKLDANGEVSDASILSGPEELRKSVLQAVLAWHFEKSVAQTTQVVTINFVKPAIAPAPPPLVPATGGRGGRGGSGREAPFQPLPATTPVGSSAQIAFRTTAADATNISHIVVNGLSDSATADLRASLPVHEGDPWSQQALYQTRAAVTQFDQHLITGVNTDRDGQISLVISAPPANVFNVGNGVLPPRLITKVDPQLSEQARAAKYGGSVTLSIVVGTDGKATNIQVVKPLGMGLDEQAIAAVQQWTFQPGTNQGVPVNVKAMVEVNFRAL
jgi:TonB family protein